MDVNESDKSLKTKGHITERQREEEFKNEKNEVYVIELLSVGPIPPSGFTTASSVRRTKSGSNKKIDQSSSFLDPA